MKLKNLIRATQSAVVLALASFLAPVHAWEPTKPIEFVVPAGTGGGADQTIGGGNRPAARTGAGDVAVRAVHPGHRAAPAVPVAAQHQVIAAVQHDDGRYARTIAIIADLVADIAADQAVGCVYHPNRTSGSISPGYGTSINNSAVIPGWRVDNIVSVCERCQSREISIIERRTDKAVCFGDAPTDACCSIDPGYGANTCNPCV